MRIRALGRTTLAIALATVGSGCTSTSHGQPPRHETSQQPQSRPLDRRRSMACTAKVIAARAGKRAAQSSNDELVIDIKNTAQAACTVSGYPRIRVVGLASTPDAAALQRLRVQHGATYFASDPSPRPITLRPGGTATFSIATTTGFGHADAITSLRIALRRWGSGRGLELTCDLPISAPPGRPAPVWETALTS
jgi:hypothetical protein